MKNIFILLILVFTLGCSKDPKDWITGTVIGGPSCDPTGVLVKIDQPDPSVYSFLCHDSPTTTGWNCRNSIFIKHMPSSLASPGTRIKFSKWEDFSVGCSSSSWSSHYVEVHDLSKL
jgi:hypothetical protein